MQHLDLLFGARRLWKLRLESCRLVDLERQILGVEREGDLPGELIPYYYFDYLRTRQAFPAGADFPSQRDGTSFRSPCLTAIVPFAFRDPARAPVRHGADLIGVARWLLETERHDEGLGLLRRAIEIGLPDRLLFRTLWDIAITEKKLGREPAALAGFTGLTESPNPYRTQAYEELAKYYEHRERNYAMALEMTRSGLGWEDSPALRRREQRLKDRIARRQARSPKLPL